MQFIIVLRLKVQFTLLKTLIFRPFSLFMLGLSSLEFYNKVMQHFDNWIFNLKKVEIKFKLKIRINMNDELNK